MPVSEMELRVLIELLNAAGFSAVLIESPNDFTTPELEAQIMGGDE